MWAAHKGLVRAAPANLTWAGNQRGEEPCPLSTETFGFFLPRILCKAPMRVHFIDNFMTLTISPCNRIFKMAPCLQVDEIRAVFFPPLPAAKTSLPGTMALKYQKVSLGRRTVRVTLTTFIFHLEIKAKTCFLNLCFTSFIGYYFSE